jgi:hypothetical protein
MQDAINGQVQRRSVPWNRAKPVGPKPPLKAKEIWSIRIRLQVAHRVRGLALFNLALDSKLRACDLVALRVDDMALNGRVRSRAIVLQRKTGRPVQFEITNWPPTRNWLECARLRAPRAKCVNAGDLEWSSGAGSRSIAGLRCRDGQIGRGRSPSGLARRGRKSGLGLHDPEGSVWVPEPGSCCEGLQHSA